MRKVFNLFLTFAQMQKLRKCNNEAFFELSKKCAFVCSLNFRNFEGMVIYRYQFKAENIARIKKVLIE